MGGGQDGRKVVVRNVSGAEDGRGGGGGEVIYSYALQRSIVTQDRADAFVSPSGGSLAGLLASFFGPAVNESPS